MKKIIFIVPSYNEEKTVGAVVKSLSVHYPQSTILVINDASCDRTQFEAHACGAEVISLAFNLGIGGAVQTGFQYALRNGFDVAVQCDADGQHDARYVSNILEPVISQDLDICIGSRFLSKDKIYRGPVLRMAGIRFFSFFISLLVGQKVTDPTSGFRAFSKRMIGFFAGYYPVDFPEPESIVIARRHGAKIAETPVVMHNRRAGSSSIRHLKTGYYMVKVTLAVVLCLLRRRRSEI